MMKKQTYKNWLKLAGLMSLVFIPLGIIVYLPEYYKNWEHYLAWVIIFILAVSFILPLGNKIIGDPLSKKPWPMVAKGIIFSYFIILLFMGSALVLLISTVGEAPPQDILSVLTESFNTMGYEYLIYPWGLYALGVLILGLLGYSKQQLSLGVAINYLIPKYQLNENIKFGINLIAIVGFYIGTLVLIGLSALALTKLMSIFLGFPISFKASLIMVGVGFGIVYFPLSPLWKTLMQKLENTQFNLGGILLAVLLILSIFVLFIYGALHVFLVVFAEHFVPIEALLQKTRPVFPLSMLGLLDLLWAFSMVTMIVVAAWWIQIIQGYTVRQALVILISPLLLIKVFLVLSHYIDFSFIILWFFTTPQAYAISLISSSIIISTFWYENNFIKGLKHVIPKGHELDISTWKKTLLASVAFLPFSMMLNITMDIFYGRSISLLLAILFSFILALAIVAFIKYLIRGKNHV